MKDYIDEFFNSMSQEKLEKTWEKYKEKTGTSEQWNKLYPHLTILDPDGWDRKNYQYSWFEEEITEEEFLKRVSTSTCMNKMKI